jgi:hypothetical protein
VQVQLVLPQYLIQHLPLAAEVVDQVDLEQHLKLAVLAEAALVVTQRAQQVTHLQLLHHKVLQAVTIILQTTKQTAVAAVAVQ